MLIKECSFCLKKKDELSKLYKCKKCYDECSKKILYCSVLCQKQDWESHKIICGKQA